MAKSKIDGVIESLRYGPDGRILLARVYERHGAVWSDGLLLDRPALLGRLKAGRRFVTGTRRAFLGSVFTTGLPVRCSQGFIVTGEPAGGQDRLEQVPLF